MRFSQTREKTAMPEKLPRGKFVRVIGGFNQISRRLKLIGQSLSALCASSLKNVSAVCSSHSLSEAVLLFSLTLFGLVSSEHYMHLLDVYRKRVALQPFYAFTQ